ncbi:hypothetical protein FGO68_gene16236 [Halteria grandinella]|uniref:Uncharacterized protein n=1 Tax=Halteria grandinella TaxID=5974 RepID=A0A8J8N9K6_HALGN|nr:hypothetical protein FGO68_gene16236 [Halteria grandinella]
MSTIEFNNALAHLIHDACIVSSHQNCCALSVNAIAQLHDSHRCCWVKVSSRLICNKDWWAADICSSNRYALLLAT